MNTCAVFGWKWKTNGCGMEEIGKWGNDSMGDNESGVSLGVNGYGMDIGVQTCWPHREMPEMGVCGHWADIEGSYAGTIGHPLNVNAKMWWQSTDKAICKSREIWISHSWIKVRKTCRANRGDKELRDCEMRGEKSWCDKQSLQFIF